MAIKNPVIADAPRVNYSSQSGVARNAGASAQSIADVLGHFAREYEDRLDVRAQVDGARQGTIAGAGETLPSLMDETTIRGQAFNRAARDSAMTRMDLAGRLALADIEKKHQADPAGFEAAAAAYLEGVSKELQAFDPGVAQKFSAEFTLRATGAQQRVQERMQAILRDRQIETALRNQMAVQDDLAADAGRLFSGDAAQTQEVLTRMMGNAVTLIDMASHMGADGKPLFDARQRVAMEREAQNAVAQNVMIAWMREQPDMITAFDLYQKGEADIVLVHDGEEQRINLKDVLGERGYQHGGKAFMETMRGELALQAQIHTAQDRDFKRSSDALYADMAVLAQEGRLTMNLVEAARVQLEPEKYLTLREITKGGFATVSDGGVLMRLMEADAAGVDISADLRAAKDSLTQNDFVQLYNRNTVTVGESVKNPVQAGRDYLVKGIGGLATVLGPEQSAQIGFADTEYDIEIERFIGKEGRQPGYQEARDIAERVRVRYSQAAVDDVVQFLPLPQSITNAERGSLTPAEVQKRVQAANQRFLALHQGDAVKRDADPEYRREMMLLKQFYDALTVEQQRRDDGGRIRR